MRYTIAIIRDGEIVDSVEVVTDDNSEEVADFHLEEFAGGILDAWVSRRIKRDLERKV